MVATQPRRLQPLRAASSEPRRIDALDGLRGLAVLAVLGYHLNGGTFPTATDTLEALFYILSNPTNSNTTFSARFRHMVPSC